MSKIVVSVKDRKFCSKSRKLLEDIARYFGFEVKEIKIDKIYDIRKELSSQELDIISRDLLRDPILEEAMIGENPSQKDFDWSVEISFKSGLTDTLGKTAQTTIEDCIKRKFTPNEGVKTIRRYLFKGTLSYDEVYRVAEEFLANPLVENITVRENRKIPYEVIDLEHDLEEISETRGLALNYAEMNAIKDYFSRETTLAERQKIGLPPAPTDVEIEALAQTWSEHCRHKIFNARVDYYENGVHYVINSLFRTYIKGATEKLAQKIDWLVSVFSDNAGIISFNDKYNLAFKVETHNSPSALDPYGGALTGILGVMRDIMGAGLGARLIACTDVLCFADPGYSDKLPERILHPRRVFEGVRLGIEHGGNKSGVPTVNGAIFFDNSYLGKPTVFCGAIGLQPGEIKGRPAHIKEIRPGDRIIIAGGRTGKDGIHGATFSSEELHAQSPSEAVQIGDPFTQKKLHDFLLAARDAGLFRAITDNGAGGFSSSVGELAILCGGCHIELDKAPLKHMEMRPWEILLSESQERMTLAADPAKIEPLKQLAEIHEVEIADIGEFTDSGNFAVSFQEETIALLSMEFLYNGCPRMCLEAVWEKTEEKAAKVPDSDITSDLYDLLKSNNLSSRETIVRQYDTEVQGGTLLKPFAGIGGEGPNDAAIIQPIDLLGEKEAIVIANGICPQFSPFDTYHMAASALDEAIRNAISCGCSPRKMAVLDNFSWPDPIYHPEKTADGKYKMAQLVRANKALYDYSLAFETPIISGKDSMKNDYKIGRDKISVLPTLLISLIGVIPDIDRAVSTDFKRAKDIIYIVGSTKKELAGSAYFRLRDISGGSQPKVDAIQAKTIYHQLHIAIAKGLVASCHDLSEGGLATAVVESSIGGDLGSTIDLKALCCRDLDDREALFSESNSRFCVSVAPGNKKEFERVMQGVPCAGIGKTLKKRRFVVKGFSGNIIIDEDIADLKEAWKNG